MLRQLTADDVILKREEFENLFFECKKASTGIEPTLEFCKNKISSLIEYLSENRAYLFGWVEDGCICGFSWSCIIASGDSEKMHLLYLVVDPEHRRKGIGASLIRATEEKAKQLGIRVMELNVSAYNTSALKIYEKIDYKPDHITMVKHL